MSVNRSFALCLLFVLAVTSGCVSGPPTRYYALKPGNFTALQTAPAEDFSLGLAAVNIPDLYEAPGIVSRGPGNRVEVASFHVWAGEFGDSIDRLLAVNLMQLTGQSRIWTAPWDNRIRPEYQLRVVVHELVGEIDSGARLHATWTLLGERGSRLLHTRQFQGEAVSTGKGVDGYVGAINKLLNDFSATMAEAVLADINSGSD